jgi:hypothetical protein
LSEHLKSPDVRHGEIINAYFTEQIEGLPKIIEFDRDKIADRKSFLNIRFQDGFQDNTIGIIGLEAISTFMAECDCTIEDLSALKEKSITTYTKGMATLGISVGEPVEGAGLENVRKRGGGTGTGR